MNANLTTETMATAVRPFVGWRAWAAQGALVTAAIVLPAVCHILGLPVRYLLPMHWPVILAGLLYGWRGGLIVGLLAPGTNYLLTGYPLMLKMVAMTVELATYGGVTGWLVERGWKGWKAVGVSLLAGRVAFLAMILALSATDGMGFWAFAAAAMLPGLAGGVGMAGVLPQLVPRQTKSRT